jgi:hypothetical protein
MPLNTILENTMYKQQYRIQKENARKRNIIFDLSYEQWLEIWGDKISQRGRGRGKYCMARNNDTGPYNIDNVRIIPFEENNREQHDFLDNHDHYKKPKSNRRSNHYKTYPVEVMKKKEGIWRRFDCIQDAADFYLVDKSTIGRNLRGMKNGAFNVRRI